MGNWPSISLVLRTIAPALKTAWLRQQRDLDLLDARRPETIRPSSRSARAGMFASQLAADLRLELGALDREPVGVGRDHRHLLRRWR